MSFNYTETQCIIILINYQNISLCQKDLRMIYKESNKIEKQPLRKKPNNSWTNTGKIEKEKMIYLANLAIKIKFCTLIYF